MAAARSKKIAIDLFPYTPLVPEVKKAVRNLGFTKKLETLTATPRSPVARTCKKTEVLPQQCLAACIWGKKSYLFARTIPRKIISSGIIPKTKDIW
jgi:hypothetical protein